MRSNYTSSPTWRLLGDSGTALLTEPALSYLVTGLKKYATFVLTVVKHRVKTIGLSSFPFDGK
jgi:hypothetical protein